jgi:hypothetical protein
VGVSLQEEHQDSTDQVDAEGGHGDYRDTLAQAAMGGGAGSSYVVDLPSGCCHRTVDHLSRAVGVDLFVLAGGIGLCGAEGLGESDEHHPDAARR